MKKKILVLVLGAVLGVWLTNIYVGFQPYEQKRESIINDVQEAIDEKVESGGYRCCIEPACDMCFLGHWLWDDGTCRCDDMIIAGELDKVCPQCKKGIEDGTCESTPEDYCVV